jgi:hypothetical protein
VADTYPVANVFEAARRMGIIRPGFTGTYADIVSALEQAEDEFYEAQMEAEIERRAEAARENDARYAWEHEEDMRRAWR